MEESGASMKVTHTCMKAYFMKNRTVVVTITTRYFPKSIDWKDIQPSGNSCHRKTFWRSRGPGQIPHAWVKLRGWNHSTVQDVTSE